MRGLDCGGGGYGDALERDPERVLRDVLERWETLERARNVYGIVFNGRGDNESLALDMAASEIRRAELRVSR